jgi:hypothetical protein
MYISVVEMKPVRVFGPPKKKLTGGRRSVVLAAPQGILC